MNFKEWLISEEIFPNNTAIVYHRTCKYCDEEKSVKAVSGILTSDFKTGSGTDCMYGCGLYTTFAIESQFTDYMKMYGQAVVKFKVEDLDKYLIFQLSVAKQIHGKDYKISDQLKKLGVLNKVDESKLKEYDERQEKENYSSTLAKEFYDKNTWIVNSLKGIIYYGKNDGYCLLKYKPVQDGSITMLAYAVAYANNQQKMEELKGNIGWIKSTNKASIKSIYKSPISNREKFSFGENDEIINQLLNSKNLELTIKKIGSKINKLTDHDFNTLLGKSTDKDKMAELIINKKPKLTINDVRLLLYSATKKDKIAELIIKNKPELSDHDVDNLVGYANDEYKISELIVKYKKEINDNNVNRLLYRATDKNKNKIAELIIEKKPEFSSRSVSSLLHSATDRYKMAELIINKNPKLSHDVITALLYKETDKYKMVELIIKKIPKIDSFNVRQFLYGEDNIDKIVELIIKKQPEFDSWGVFSLLNYATDKEKIAERLQEKEDNISKLSRAELLDLIHFSNDKKQMAQIINKYHTKKTPEIQELIDKYLQPQTIAAK